MTLADLQARTDWAVISAEQSGRSAADNRQRTEYLHTTLGLEGYNVFSVAGVYDGVRERSFLVLGIDRGSAVCIARDFGQESVLLPDGLHFVALGETVPSSGLVAGTDPQNCSTVEGPDSFSFVSVLDWSARRVA